MSNLGELRVVHYAEKSLASNGELIPAILWQAGNCSQLRRYG